MNYLVYATALHLEPRPGVSLKRFRALLPEPGATSPPVSVRTRRRSLPRILAAMSARRRWGGTPRRRLSADGGVSPVAGAATRGVAFLVDR